MADIRDRSIAECPNCFALITPSEIEGRVRSVSGTVNVPVGCVECESQFLLRFSRDQWDRIVDHVRHAESRERARIGREVAAFRKVDLAVVKSVEDILPFWSVPFGEVEGL